MREYGPVYTNQASVSALRHYASDTVLIENNGVAPDWGCNPFSSNSMAFNKNSITSQETSKY